MMDANPDLQEQEQELVEANEQVQDLEPSSQTESEAEAITESEEPGAADGGTEAHAEGTEVVSEQTDQAGQAEQSEQAEQPQQAELPSVDALQAAMAEVRMSGDDAELPEAPPFRVEDLDRHIEALVFTADVPVQAADVVDALNRAHGLELDHNVVQNHLDALIQKYADAAYPFQVVESGGGYRFMSKVDYHESISYFLNLKSKRRLSRAAMETLAIIAYRQPVSKSEVENIRGVSCDYSIQKLLEKELIEISGRADTPGKPLLYSTSKAFMDHFGINSTEDLPKLKEFVQAGQELGISPEALDPEQLSGEAPMPKAPQAGADAPDVYAPENSADVETAEARQEGIAEGEIPKAESGQAESGASEEQASQTEGSQDEAPEDEVLQNGDTEAEEEADGTQSGDELPKA